MWDWSSVEAEVVAEGDAPLVHGKSTVYPEVSVLKVMCNDGVRLSLDGEVPHVY